MLTCGKRRADVLERRVPGFGDLLQERLPLALCSAITHFVALGFLVCGRRQWERQGLGCSPPTGLAGSEAILFQLVFCVTRQ